MLADAAEVDRGLFAQVYDACVIGAGPAGITLARRLAAGGFRVALMEGGDLTVKSEAQEVFEGDSVGQEYDPLDIVRLRTFGGASEHWGGRCRELDSGNFGPLGHVPLHAWPIGKSDLDPYAAAADEILELPPAAGDLPLAQKTDRFRRVEYRLSPPTRFAERYGDEIAAAPLIHCLLNANLVDLRLDESDGSIREAVFRTYDPGAPSFTVRARIFCLCLGGLENPRLLLNCNSQRPAGLGNEHDQVGRYFCDHPNYRIGEAHFSPPLAEADAFPPGKEIAFVPTDAYLERFESLSFAIVAFPKVEDHLTLGTELARAASCVAPAANALAARLTGHAVDCDRGGIYNYFVQPQGRVATRAHVRLRAEQSVLADSRVMLGDARDRFGHRRIVLDWRLGEVDLRSFRRAMLEFASHFAEQDIGRVRVIDWALEPHDTVPPLIPGQFVAGSHHMCTTRMASDPRHGVVDANCRVHSVPNLYVGGSSVFSSPGYANPTYTIVQLALRLGDHLSERLHA